MKRTDKNLIKQLQDYFQKEPSVLLAFLFGSRAKNIERKISDWDIGVYFKPKEYLELETEQDYPGENKMWSRLIHILKTDDVDFVVLNRARPALVYNVLRTGVPLIMKDKKLYFDLLCKVSYEAMDWWNFVFDFYKISEKAMSISPEARTQIIEHLKFLDKEFKEIEIIKNFTWQDYLKDSFKRKIIERWVENLVMASIDIAEIVLASERKTIPQSYKDVLKVFTTLYVDSSMADKFSEFARLRNIAVHEYLDMRWKRIKDFVEQGEILYPKFIRKVKELLK